MKKRSVSSVAIRHLLYLVFCVVSPALFMFPVGPLFHEQKTILSSSVQKPHSPSSSLSLKSIPNNAILWKKTNKNNNFFFSFVLFVDAGFNLESRNLLDNFNRPDSSLSGEGWASWYGDQGLNNMQDVNISAGELRVHGFFPENISSPEDHPFGSGIYQSHNVSFPLTVSFDYRPSTVNSVSNQGWWILFNVPKTNLPDFGKITTSTIHQGYFLSHLFLASAQGSLPLQRSFQVNASSMSDWESISPADSGVSSRDYPSSVMTSIEISIEADLSGVILVTYHDGLLPKVISYAFSAPAAGEIDQSSVLSSQEGSYFVLGVPNAPTSSSGGNSAHFFDNLVLKDCPEFQRVASVSDPSSHSLLQTLMSDGKGSLFSGTSTTPCQMIKFHAGDMTVTSVLSCNETAETPEAPTTSEVVPTTTTEAPNATTEGGNSTSNNSTSNSSSSAPTSPPAPRNICMYTMVCNRSYVGNCSRPVNITVNVSIVPMDTPPSAASFSQPNITEIFGNFSAKKSEEILQCYNLSSISFFSVNDTSDGNSSSVNLTALEAVLLSNYTCLCDINSSASNETNHSSNSSEGWIVCAINSTTNFENSTNSTTNSSTVNNCNCSCRCFRVSNDTNSTNSSPSSQDANVTVGTVNITDYIFEECNITEEMNCSVLCDPLGNISSSVTNGIHGYFGTDTRPGYVLKVDLAGSMSRVGRYPTWEEQQPPSSNNNATEVRTGRNHFQSAILVGNFGYFSSSPRFSNEMFSIFESESATAGNESSPSSNSTSSLSSVFNKGNITDIGYPSNTTPIVSVLKLNLDTMELLDEYTEFFSPSSHEDFPFINVENQDAVVGSGITCATTDGFYGYFAIGKNSQEKQLPRILKIRLDDMTLVATGYAPLMSDAFSSVMNDGTYAYFGTTSPSPSTLPASILKYKLKDMSLVGRYNGSNGEVSFQGGATTDETFGYFGTSNPLVPSSSSSAAGSIVKIRLSDMIKMSEATSTVATERNFIATATDGVYSYFTTNSTTSPSRVVKFSMCGSPTVENFEWGLVCSGIGACELGSPARRALHQMVYDTRSKSTIMYGGWTGSEHPTDIWMYFSFDMAWQRKAPPATAPSGRIYFAMFEDPHQRKIYIQGGYNFNTGKLQDTWEYESDGNKWVQKTDCPVQLQRHAMGYDPNLRKAILVFGETGGSFVNVIYSYVPATDTWSLITSASFSLPPPRGNPGFVFDLNAKLFILFGGNDGNTATVTKGRLDDTWSFNASDELWRKRNPPLSPSPRTWHSMIYDKLHQTVVVFGGDNADGQTSRDDTWSFDSRTSRWTQLNPPVKPPPRIFGAMSFDDKTKVLVMFGGLHVWVNGYKADLWMTKLPEVKWCEAEDYYLSFYRNGSLSSAYTVWRTSVNRDMNLNVGVAVYGSGGTIYVYRVYNERSIVQVKMVSIPRTIRTVDLSKDGKVVLVSCYEGGMAIVNVTDPMEAEMLYYNRFVLGDTDSRWGVSNLVLTHDYYIYKVCARYTSTYLYVLDATNLRAPIYKNYIGIPNNLYRYSHPSVMGLIQSSENYLQWMEKGVLRTFDISNRVVPNLISSVTWKLPSEISNSGTYGIVQNDTMLYLGSSRTIEAVNIVNATNPYWLGSYPESAATQMYLNEFDNLVISGGKIYATYENTFNAPCAKYSTSYTLVAASDAALFTYGGSSLLTAIAKDGTKREATVTTTYKELFAMGEALLVANGKHGLQKYAVNATTFLTGNLILKQVAPRETIFDDPLSVDSDGKHIVTAAGSDGLRWYNFEEMKHLGAYFFPGEYIFEARMYKGDVALALTGSYLVAVNFSKPKYPVLVGRFQISGKKLTIGKEVAYVQTDDNSPSWFEAVALDVLPQMRSIRRVYSLPRPHCINDTILFTDHFDSVTQLWTEDLGNIHSGAPVKFGAIPILAPSIDVVVCNAKSVAVQWFDRTITEHRVERQEQVNPGTPVPPPAPTPAPPSPTPSPPSDCTHADFAPAFAATDFYYYDFKDLGSIPTDCDHLLRYETSVAKVLSRRLQFAIEASGYDLLFYRVTVETKVIYIGTHRLPVPVKVIELGQNDTILYVSCYEAGYAFINVSDPIYPETLYYGRYYGGEWCSYCGVSNLLITRNDPVMYKVVSTYSTSYLIYVNVTDLRNPVPLGYVSSIGGTRKYQHPIYNLIQAAEDVLYFMDTTVIRMYNISDPKNVGAIFLKYVYWTLYSNIYGSYYMGRNESILFLADNRQIAVMNVSDEVNPNWLGSIYDSSASRFVMNGSTIVVTSGKILAPYQIDYLPANQTYPKVGWYGWLIDSTEDAFVLFYSGNERIWAVSRDGSQQRAWVKREGFKQAVTWGNVLLTACGPFGIQKYSLDFNSSISTGTIQLLQHVGAASGFDDPRAIDTNGEIFVTAAGSDGLRIYDFDSMTQLGYVHFPAQTCWAAKLYDNFTAVALLGSEMVIVNITNRTMPTVIASYMVTANRVEHVGHDTVYVSQNGGTIYAINMLDVTRPIYIRTLSEPGVRCWNDSVIYTENYDSVAQIWLEDLGGVHDGQVPLKFNSYPIVTHRIYQIECSSREKFAVQDWTGVIREYYFVNRSGQPQPQTPKPPPPPTTPAPPTPPPPGSIPICNYSQLERTVAETSPSVNYKFQYVGTVPQACGLWNWETNILRAVSDQRPIAVKATGSTLYIYRINPLFPSTPIDIGYVGVSRTIRTVDLTPDGNYAILSCVEGGISIVNVTYAVSPKQIYYGRWVLAEDLYTWVGVSNVLITYDNILYKVFTRYWTGWIIMVNVSNFLEGKGGASYLGSYSFGLSRYARCCSAPTYALTQTSENYIQWMDYEYLRTFDITDRVNPRIIASMRWTRNPSNAQYGMKKNGSQVLFLGSQRTLDAVDIRKDAKPEWAGSISETSASRLVLNGSVLVVSSGETYLPNELNYIPPDKHYPADSRTLVHVSSVGIWTYGSNYLYVRATDGTNRIIGKYIPLFRAMASYEDYIVTANGNDGVERYRVNETAFSSHGQLIWERRTAQLNWQDVPQDIATDGKVVITAAGQYGIRLYDFESFNYTGGLYFPGQSCYSVELLSSEILVASLGDELLLVNISDFTAPMVLNSTAATGRKIHLARRTNVTYLHSDGTTSALAVNVTNVKHPSMISTSFAVPSSSASYCFNDTLLFRYLTDSVATIIIEDLSYLPRLAPFEIARRTVRTFSLKAMLCEENVITSQWWDGTITQHDVAEILKLLTVCTDLTDCSNHSTWVNGTYFSGCSCLCEVGYNGSFCEYCSTNYTESLDYGYPTCEEILCNSSHDCHNHADMVNGTLVSGCRCTQCSIGFAGPTCGQCADNYEHYPNCTERPCTVEGNCTGHADLVNGTWVTGCTCSCSLGYNGSTCEYCALDYQHYPNCEAVPCDVMNDCSNHAIAVDGNRTSGCSCNCSTGYVGATCNACESYFYTGYPTCVPAMCNSSDCQDHAEALEGVRLTGCSCNCTTEYNGTYCDECAARYEKYPNCSKVPCHFHNCNNHADAVAGNIVDGCVCICSAGYTGENCSVCDVNYENYPNCSEVPCEVSRDCSNHADATSGTLVQGCVCQCSTGFSRSTCDQCAANYSGYPDCNEIPCTNLADCNNHAPNVSGTLVTGCTCGCSQNYAGTYCDVCAEFYHSYPWCHATRCDESDCNFHAASLDGNRFSGCHCTCQKQYNGSLCDTCAKKYERYPNCTAVPCPISACHDHAQEIKGNIVDGCVCICKVGYTGENCSVCDVNYEKYPNCSEVPCNLAEACDSHTDSVSGTLIQGCTCHCKLGYSGEKCQQCSANFSGYPNCQETPCSNSADCNNHAESVSGTLMRGCSCQCKHNYLGSKCESCAVNYTQYPWCKAESCGYSVCNDHAKTVTGYRITGCACTCLPAFNGTWCDKCADDYEQYPTCSPKPTPAPPVFCTHFSLSKVNCEMKGCLWDTWANQCVEPIIVVGSIIFSGNVTVLQALGGVYPTNFNNNESHHNITVLKTENFTALVPLIAKDLQNANGGFPMKITSVKLLLLGDNQSSIVALLKVEWEVGYNNLPQAQDAVSDIKKLENRTITTSPMQVLFPSLSEAYQSEISEVQRRQDPNVVPHQQGGALGVNSSHADIRYTTLSPRTLGPVSPSTIHPSGEPNSGNPSSNLPTGEDGSVQPHHTFPPPDSSGHPQKHFCTIKAHPLVENHSSTISSLTDVAIRSGTTTVKLILTGSPLIYSAILENEGSFVLAKWNNSLQTYTKVVISATNGNSATSTSSSSGSGENLTNTQQKQPKNHPVQLPSSIFNPYFSVSTRTGLSILRVAIIPQESRNLNGEVSRDDNSTIQVEFAAKEGFELFENTLLKINVASAFFTCQPAERHVVAEVTIVALPAQELIMAAAANTIVSASAVGSSALLSGAGALATDVQLLVILGEMNCANMIDAQTSLQSIRVISPTIWGMDKDAASIFPTMLIANVMVIACVLFLQLLIGLIWGLIQKGSSTTTTMSNQTDGEEYRVTNLSTFADVRFPSLTLDVVQLLHQGVVFGAFVILCSGIFEGDADQTTADADTTSSRRCALISETRYLSLAVFGAIYGVLIIPILAFYLVRKYVPKKQEGGAKKLSKNCDDDIQDRKIFSKLEYYPSFLRVSNWSSSSSSLLFSEEKNLDDEHWMADDKYEEAEEVLMDFEEMEKEEDSNSNPQEDHRSLLQKIFYPVGFWSPKILRHCFGSLIGNLLPRNRRYWVITELVSLSVILFVCALTLTSKKQCQLRSLSLAILFLLSALLHIIIRPYRSVFMNVAAAISKLLLSAIVCSMVLPQWIGGDDVDEKNGTHSADAMSRPIIWVFVTLTALRIVYAIWWTLIEHCHKSWKNKIQNLDFQNDERWMNMKKKFLRRNNNKTARSRKNTEEGEDMKDGVFFQSEDAMSITMDTEDEDDNDFGEKIPRKKFSKSREMKAIHPGGLLHVQRRDDEVEAAAAERRRRRKGENFLNNRHDEDSIINTEGEHQQGSDEHRSTSSGGQRQPLNEEEVGIGKPISHSMLRQATRRKHGGKKAGGGEPENDDDDDDNNNNESGDDPLLLKSLPHKQTRRSQQQQQRHNVGANMNDDLVAASNAYLHAFGYRPEGDQEFVVPPTLQFHYQQAEPAASLPATTVVLPGADGAHRKMAAKENNTTTPSAFFEDDDL